MKRVREKIGKECRDLAALWWASGTSEGLGMSHSLSRWSQTQALRASGHD